jgi:hypothetical protein
MKQTNESLPISYSELRDKFYQQWRLEWKGYNSQHAQTSSLTAYSILKSKQTPTNQRELQCSFIVISPRIVKFEEKEQLVFPTKLSKKARIQLLPKTSTQRVLLEQAQNGYWKNGQIFLTDKWCTIPFTRYLDLTSEKKDPRLQELLK